MSEPDRPAEAAPAEPRPARRRRLAHVLVLAGALVALVFVAAIALSPALRWTAAALVARAPDEAAWARIPAGRPIVAVLDVRALLRSPVALGLRPELEALAHEQGLDLELTERNARLLVLGSDGRGFAHGAATGPRLSPLLLPRFDSRWRVVTSPGADGEPLVTDGAAVIQPLEAGLVAFAVSESGGDAAAALTQALQSAARASQMPLPLDGAALRIVVEPDDALRARMVASVPREAAGYAAALARLDARTTAGEQIDGVVRLTMRSEEAAATTLGALQQLDQVLSSGLIAFLAPFLGEDASILGKIPPFDVSREGHDVVVTMSATPNQVRDLLSELQARGERETR